MTNYSRTRETLEKAAADLIEQADHYEQSLPYHREQIERLTSGATKFREQAEQIKQAARTLEALDGAGIVMKPGARVVEEVVARVPIDDQGTMLEKRVCGR